MPTILLVDDDPDLRASVGALLKQKQYAVETAENSKVAFSKIDKEKPDLILLDINMTTDQEGLDMAMKMKNDGRYSDIPIVIITGIDVMSGNSTVAEMAREMRMDPAFENLNILLLAGVDGSKALDFKSSSTGNSVNLPVAGFLRKPVTPEMLWTEIDSALINA